MMFKMERGVRLSLPEITVAIETPNVKYKAKQRVNTILAAPKPHGSLACCVYVWGSLSAHKEDPLSCNVTTTSERLGTEEEGRRPGLWTGFDSWFLSLKMNENRRMN